jgi:hypothetical protein
MIVWGGEASNSITPYHSGGRYDLATNTWRSTTIINAPTARKAHTAVWTGSEMIVWGGSDFDGGFADRRKILRGTIDAGGSGRSVSESSRRFGQSRC